MAEASITFGPLFIDCCRLSILEQRLQQCRWVTLMTRRRETRTEVEEEERLLTLARLSHVARTLNDLVVLHGRLLTFYVSANDDRTA